MKGPSVPRAILLALGLYLLWTAATYLLEGRIGTLLRPDAIADRITYALIANLLIGIGGGILVCRLFALRFGITPDRMGFRNLRHAGVAVPVGAAFGLTIYALQGAPTWEPVSLLNGFAQVLPVSMAEVLVCWAVVGVAVEAGLRSRGGAVLGPTAGVIASSAVFGLYHYAHSPPFDTFPMVVLLAAVGLLTGLFYFASRDLYGTIALHNFLAMAGVLRALEEASALQAFARPQAHLFAMAALSVGLLVLLHQLGMPPRSGGWNGSTGDLAR